MSTTTTDKTEAVGVQLPTRSLATLTRSAAWSAIEASLKQQLAVSPEVLRLQPTSRSQLRP